MVYARYIYTCFVSALAGQRKSKRPPTHCLTNLTCSIYLHRACVQSDGVMIMWTRFVSIANKSSHFESPHAPPFLSQHSLPLDIDRLLCGIFYAVISLLTFESYWYQTPDNYLRGLSAIRTRIGEHNRYAVADPDRFWRFWDLRSLAPSPDEYSPYSAVEVDCTIDISRPPSRAFEPFDA